MIFPRWLEVSGFVIVILVASVLLSQIFIMLILKGLSVLKRSLPSVRKATNSLKNFIGRFFKRSMESLLFVYSSVEALSQIVESGSFTARKTSGPHGTFSPGRFFKQEQHAKRAHANTSPS